MCYQNTVRVIQTLCKFWADLLPVLLLTLGKHSNINRSPALRLDSGKTSMGFLWWVGPFTIYLWPFLCWRYILFHHLGFTLWPFVLWWPDLPPPLCFPRGEGAFIAVRLFTLHCSFCWKKKMSWKTKHFWQGQVMSLLLTTARYSHQHSFTFISVYISLGH